MGDDPLVDFWQEVYGGPVWEEPQESWTWVLSAVGVGSWTPKDRERRHVCLDRERRRRRARGLRRTEMALLSTDLGNDVGQEDGWEEEEVVMSVGHGLAGEKVPQVKSKDSALE